MPPPPPPAMQAIVGNATSAAHVQMLVVDSIAVAKCLSRAELPFLMESSLLSRSFHQFKLLPFPGQRQRQELTAGSDETKKEKHGEEKEGV